MGKTQGPANRGVLVFLEVAKGRKMARYGGAVIYQRHRHRFEANNTLPHRSADELLIEVIELPGHPALLASRLHPESKSRPTQRAEAPK